MAVNSGKITYDDLNVILAKIDIMPDDLEETLEAWGIDGEGLVKFVFDGAFIEKEEVLELVFNPKSIFAKFILLGFTLGFQTAQEIEIRKVAAGD